MATEYKLSYTASEIDKKLGQIDNLAAKDEIPTKTSQLTNDSGFITGYTETDPTVPAWAKSSVKPSYSKSEVGLGNVDNVKQYSANNPPPYPVTSVNGKVGAVTLDASAVGARPSSWTPSYSDVGAEKSGTAAAAVSSHNTSTSAHNDIRLLVDGLSSRVNALANSTDEDLDQMAEIVAYIKNNKTLIDNVTTSKVNVTDIINNLTTNVSNKPLSAAQGVALKALIDALENDKLEASALSAAINTALAQAKASGEFDGKDGADGKNGVSATHSWNGTTLTVTSASGTSSANLKGDKGDKGETGPKGATGKTGQRGTGLLPVTTGPSSYTTAVGNITPKYRMALSTIKTQSGATEVLLGDTVRYSYYHYPIAYLDTDYAYFTTRTSIRGATGAAGAAGETGVQGPKGDRGNSIFSTNTAPKHTPDGELEYTLSEPITTVTVGDIIICETDYNLYKATLQREVGYIIVELIGNIKGAQGPAYTLTSADKTAIANSVKASLNTESWTFSLEDGSTVTKAVYVG